MRTLFDYVKNLFVVLLTMFVISYFIFKIHVIQKELKEEIPLKTHSSEIKPPKGA